VVSPSRWTGTVGFDAPAEQYCVVVGVTSVTDGSEVVSDPQCFDQAMLGVPHAADIPPSPRMSIHDPADPDSGRCLGPIVYEADGAAYPRGAGESEVAEPPAGCTVTVRGGAWLVLLALIRRRRARA
jgi:hypothetical protein